jgi:hypothetical protein
MLININEENIFSQVSFLLFVKMLNGDGPQGRKINA